MLGSGYAGMAVPIGPQGWGEAHEKLGREVRARDTEEQRSAGGSDAAHRTVSAPTELHSRRGKNTSLLHS